MLYVRVKAKQDNYRGECFLVQTPDEILSHTYERTIREETLMLLECGNLDGRDAKALFKTLTPLEDIYEDQQTA